MVKFGTDEQKSYFLPPILTGEVFLPGLLRSRSS